MSRRRLVVLVAVTAAAFHLWVAGVSPFTALVQRPVHLALMSVLGFLGLGVMGRPREGPRAVSAALALVMVVSCAYLVVQHRTLVGRIGAATPLDLALGAALILVLLELTRRTTGWGLVSVAVAALVYAVAGPWLPGFLAHRGYGPARLVEQLYLSTEGVWGIPLGVSADFVYLFVLFGTILEVAGGGALLVRLADRVAGGLRGGPAITASLASGFMGSLSGSAVANVVTTGSLTIPVMKRAGFQPHFAGAVEAAASTAGQLVPPVMGAGAFILATWTGIPYVTVAASALIPAILYYVALIMAIQFRAGRMGLQARGRERSAGAAPILPRLHLLLPVAVVVASLVAGTSPMRAAFWGVASAFGVTFLRRATRLDSARVTDALVRGATSTVQVATACATAGIVVGVASLTGIGLRLSELIVTLSMGHLPLALVLTALASIVLGMGLPTTAAYVVLAALGAPALVDLGTPVLAAHLFVFYFGCMSNVTPPVALAAFAAAGVAGASAMRTALTAVLLASAGFLVPFMFVYGPPLLLIGTPFRIGVAFLTAVVGVTCLAAAAMGWLRGPLAGWARVALALAAVLLVRPGWATDLGGILLGAGALLGGHRAVRPAGAGRLLTLAAVLALPGCSADGSWSAGFMSIGTGGTGGVYYPFGGALASRLSARLPDLRFTAEVTAASVENLKRLERGQIDLGMAIALAVRESHQGGSAEFPEPVEDLRIVAPMWPNPLNLLVPGSSDVTGVGDLRGRAVSVGAPGSGTEMVARAVLAAYGLGYDDIEERFLSFTESSSALRDGSIDAAFLEVAFPAAAVMEATTTGGARLVGLEGPEIDAFLRERPWFYATVIPAGAYRGLDRDVPTIAEVNWIVAREDLDPAVVTAVLDVLSEERAALIEVTRAVEQIDLGRLRDAPIPLHPAAARWLEARGQADTVTTGPEFVVGSLDGQDEEVFGLIAGVAGFGDGRFLVSDNQLARVQIFDSTGTYVGTVGGRGRGPGEMISPAEVAVIDGDSWVVVDIGQDAYLWFDDDQPAGRTRRPHDEPFEREAIRGTPDGVVFDSRRPRVESSDSFPVLRLTRTSSVLSVDSLWVPGGLGTVVRLVDEDSGIDAGTLLVPFTGFTPWAPASDGVTYAQPGAYRVMWWDGEQRRELFSWDRGAGGSIPERLRSVVRERPRQRLEALARQVGADADQWLDQIELTQRFPAIIRLLVGPGGHIWVLGGDSQGRPVLDVWAPEGVWLGSVRLETDEWPDVDKIGLTGSHVIGVFTTSDGVPQVRGFPIPRSLRGGA